jgi:predicted peroxiredoxin
MVAELNTMIVLTTGKQDRGTRATLAFAWGCAALAMQKTASIFLTMDGTVWAINGATKEVAVGGFEPLKNYVQQFTELGGEILVCAPCSEYYCNSGIGNGAMLIGEAKVSGMATIVGKIGLSTKVITF